MRNGMKRLVIGLLCATLMLANGAMNCQAAGYLESKEQKLTKTKLYVKAVYSEEGHQLMIKSTYHEVNINKGTAYGDTVMVVRNGNYRMISLSRTTASDRNYTHATTSIYVDNKYVAGLVDNI